MTPFVFSRSIPLSGFFPKKMTKVEVTIEDLRALIEGHLISTFQHAILIKFFFGRKQLDEIAEEFRMPKTAIIKSFNVGHKQLQEFHRLRLRNLKTIKNANKEEK